MLIKWFYDLFTCLSHCGIPATVSRASALSAPRAHAHHWSSLHYSLGMYTSSSGSRTLPCCVTASPTVNVTIMVANEVSDVCEYENWSSLSEFHSLSDGVG